MRLFGIETEYGLSVEGHSPAQQMEDAMALVSHYPGRAFAGWDYRYETPRKDLRGFEVDGLATDPVDAQWDAVRPAASERELRADRALPNGARLYNDHGHPEYATPECARLTDLVAHERAGDRLLLAAARALQEEAGLKVTVYKNNTDFHGASYGTHENYLVPRSLGFDKLLRGLLPLLVARPILVGAGKVGSEVGRPCRYQLSQRADFYHEAANIETLYRRPIFNTRDEPHADPSRWIRLHVICGDANRMEWATAMKIAMTRIALDLIEMGEAPQWRLRNPVRAAEDISKDEDRKWRVELDGGTWTTGAEILESYLSAAEELLRGRDAETDWALAEWRLAMVDLDADPTRLKDRCDWAAKLVMLHEFAENAGVWVTPTMQALDLEYHNIDPDEGLFGALEAMGRVVRIVEEQRILDAIDTPPGDTRAFLRGQAVSLFADKVTTLGWRRAVFSIGGEDRAVEFPVEPRDWTHIKAETLERWVCGI